MTAAELLDHLEDVIRATKAEEAIPRHQLDRVIARRVLDAVLDWIERRPLPHPTKETAQ